MRFTELFESPDDVLYHYTSVYALKSILESGVFNLTSDMGTDSELSHRKGEKVYYLSTARNKTAKYTMTNVYKHGVVINLDRRWMRTKYSMKPVDYWGSEWRKHDPASEQEERIYSAKPTMSASGIHSIHILVDPTTRDEVRNNKRVVECLLLAKKKGIAVFVYDTKENMIAQRNPVNISEFLKGLSIRQTEQPWSRQLTDFLSVWRELYYKKNWDDLSSGAKRRMYPSYLENDFITQLKSDIHNAKSGNRESLIKTMKMFQDGGFKTVGDFKKFVADKWVDHL